MSDKHEVQRDVEEMHRSLRILIGDGPAIRRPELRVALLREEAAETIEAIEGGDLIEAIDGMCDLLAVIYGTAVEFGVNLAPFWDEVHKTNMAKENREPGLANKLVKPDGWEPPNLAPILAAQVNNYEEAA